MIDKQTKLKFLKLRGAGYSFSKIAKYLKVSKWTLIRWAKQHKKILSDLQKIHLESLKENIFLSEKNKLEILVKDFYQLDDEVTCDGKTINEREILMRMKYSVLDRINKFEKNFNLDIFSDDSDDLSDLSYIDDVELLDELNNSIAQNSGNNKNNNSNLNSSNSVLKTHEKNNPQCDNSDFIPEPLLNDSESPQQIYYHKFKPLNSEVSIPKDDNDENNDKELSFNPRLIRGDGSHSFGEIPFSDFVNSTFSELNSNDSNSDSQSDQDL